jgi:thiol:disulfide interchange protein DsbD
MEQFLKKFVVVRMYVDGDLHIADPLERKRRADDALSIQLKYLEDTTVPAFAVVTPDGQHVLARYYGAFSAGDLSSFREVLDDGWAKWEQLKAAKRP